MRIQDDHLELLPLSSATKHAQPAAILLLLCMLGGGYMFASNNNVPTKDAPSRQEDLASGIVTFVPPDDQGGIATAVAALKVPVAQRAEISRTLIDNKRRIGWIVFTDSIDPDGDTIAVESSGLIQHIVLTKSWTPVAVALDDGAPIKVTAVHDGIAGGVTIAFATRSGVMPMRILRPGEHVEVVP